MAYLVDGKDAALDNGEVQSFSGAGARVVDFDRGGDFGSARMELTPGDYEFVIGDNGWQLVRDDTKPAKEPPPPIAKKNVTPSATR